MTKKEEFIARIKKLFNVQLENEKTEVFNQKRNWLYTRINDNCIIEHMIKHNIIFCWHYKGYCWIKVY